jgi:hypothetical protein
MSASPFAPTPSTPYSVLTTPTEPAPHGVLPPRGLARAPQSSLKQGRFGRMFRNLPVYSHRRETLIELGGQMIQELEDGELDKDLGQPDDDENIAQLGDELRLPAGYTYFGQFVDHDITFDPVSSLTRQNDPDALENFRTPAFDLDNLYGRGPSEQPYLYDKDGVHMALGGSVDPDDATSELGGPDLPRAVANDRAIIGDPRNDENLIVSQLQSVFLRFHNRVLDHLKAQDATKELPDQDLFKLAQQQVRWHYQWVVIHDYLRRLVGDEVIDDIVTTEISTVAEGVQVDLPKLRLRYYAWENTPYMPVEFSVAAYRFGHSMIRPSYFINDFARTFPDIPGVHRIQLFRRGATTFQSLRGFGPLPAKWGVQWKYFLPGIRDAAGPRDGDLPQPSYKLDAQLSNPLRELTDTTAAPEALLAGADPSLAQVLAIRNLFRGLELGLPSGQDVARAMNVVPLENDDLLDGLTLTPVARQDLEDNAPLWYYILKEAELGTGAAHLGPVGGRIVAEVLIGLLAGDELSYINVSPGWTPTLDGTGTFTLSDLVNFAVHEPLGSPPAAIR